MFLGHYRVIFYSFFSECLLFLPNVSLPRGSRLLRRWQATRVVSTARFRTDQTWSQTGQFSRTVETAQRIGFNLSVPNTACAMPRTELHPPASERPRFGLKRTKVEYVDLPLALTHQFRLYRVASSTFKTDESDGTRFERSSSSSCADELPFGTARRLTCTRWQFARRR